jgi:hypothetical protein
MVLVVGPDRAEEVLARSDGAVRIGVVTGGTGVALV